MAAMDVGLSDVSFTGLDDTALSYSGESTFQDVTSIGSPLQLDTSGGQNDITSTYDLWDMIDPQSSLSLSGVSDPPFQSATLSTPNPSGTVLSSSASTAFNALSKFGSSLASLLGQHTATYAPAGQSLSAANTNRQPIGAVTGTSLTLLLIIAAAAFLLIAKGGE